MDGIKSTPLSPFMGLPDDVICNIVTFCNASTGVGLSATCRGLRHLLLKEVRKVQIVLISRVAEGIEKSGLLKDDARRGLIERRDRAVEGVQNGESLQVIAAMGASLFQGREGIVLEDEIKWLPPFVSIVDGHRSPGHHFIPPYLETTICQLMVETTASHVSDRSSLQEAIRLMREGRFDQTEESTKVERDGKSCVLAGLGKAATQLWVMDRPLFFHILARIERKEVQEEFLLFCIKNSPQCSVIDPEISNFLTNETFFSSLSTKTQIQVMEELFHKIGHRTALTLALHSSDPAVKKKALELGINAADSCLSPLIDPDTLFLILDIGNSIPLAERKGPVCALIERFEEIYRPYQPEFPDSSEFWNREFNKTQIYPEAGVRDLLRVIMKDNRWSIEPPAKMVEEWWELLSHFPKLDHGLCAYFLLMQAASCVQCETPREEMSHLMNIIFEKINRIEKGEEKRKFIESVGFCAPDVLENLIIKKSIDFINYEFFIDQIKVVIRGMVGDDRDQFQHNFNVLMQVFLKIEPTFFSESGRRCYPYLYILTGMLQEAFPKGAEKDGKIMAISQFYKAYNMKEDALAQKMMQELVDQIEDQEIKREVLLRLV